MWRLAAQRLQLSRSQVSRLPSLSQHLPVACRAAQQDLSSLHLPVAPTAGQPTTSNLQSVRRSTGEAGAATTGLSAAVLLERRPVIIPEEPAWALEYKEFSFERQQQYRLDYPQEFVDQGSERGGVVDADQTPFKPAPRETEADEKNDRRSLERALDKSLYLLLKDSSDRWWFPQKLYSGEETMRKCAEAAFSPLGGDSSVYFVGNAPCGHLVDQPGKDEKTFFFRAQFLLGNLQTGPYQDYAWVHKEELLDYVNPESKAFFEKLLVDDGW